MSDEEKKALELEQALEAKVAAGMDKAGLDVEDADEIEEVAETEEKKETEETEEVEEEVVEEIEETEEEKEGTEETGDKEAEGEKPPTLTDSYVRAAIHQGWTQEQVDEFFGTDPEMAVKTFEKIYESTNKISQQFAELGRKTIEKNNQPEPVEKKTSKKVEVDFSAVEKEYGKDDPLLAMAKAQDERIQILVDKLEEVSTATPVEKQAAKNEIDSAVVAQIDTFFNDADIKSYFDDFYGNISDKENDWGRLTPGQQANRAAVLTMADEILVGTELQGRRIETGEALKMAHLSVSDPIKEQVIRTKIKKQVTKRSKSITLKPNTGNKNAVKKGGPVTEAELEKKVAEGLRKIHFGN